MPTSDLCTKEEIHAESLWYGYQMSRQPDPLPQEL